MASNNWRHGRNMLMVFLTCGLVYLVFWSGHHYSIDGVVMFQYAKSILFRHTFNLEPPVQWGTEISVSTWPVGLTFVYAGVLAFLSSIPWLSHIDFSLTPHDPGEKFNQLLLYDPTYRYSSFVNPLITAFSASLIYLICIHLGLSTRRSAAAALVFGIASPAAVYAKLDYAQPLASLFVILALLFFIKARQTRIEYLVLFRYIAPVQSKGVDLRRAFWMARFINISAVANCQVLRREGSN